MGVRHRPSLADGSPTGSKEPITPNSGRKARAWSHFTQRTFSKNSSCRQWSQWKIFTSCLHYEESVGGEAAGEDGSKNQAMGVKVEHYLLVCKLLLEKWRFPLARGNVWSTTGGKGKGVPVG